MKNIFSYQYGSVFTGKVLKESIQTMSVKKQCDLLEKIKNF